MNKIVADGLKIARDLIEQPEHWTNDIEKLSEEKEIYCAITALCMVLHPNMKQEDFDIAENYLMDAMDGKLIPYWNDTHTHEEVLKAFDKAIELAMK